MEELQFSFFILSSIFISVYKGMEVRENSLDQS